MKLHKIQSQNTFAVNISRYKPTKFGENHPPGQGNCGGSTEIGSGNKEIGWMDRNQDR